ncbi:MAG: AAA family ATPase [Bacteroidota bacterium]
MKKIYVAATGQHKGKTTCTLGIAANFQSQGHSVGYCKPVGQQHLTINERLADKDAVLFGDTLGFAVQPELHSPVVLASGVTSRFIDDPSEFTFSTDIAYAAQRLEADNDVVVYEGTGHPGVGSIINLSNAQVARQLGTDAVIIVEGGIGKTIDRLNMGLALFREEGVNVCGVIVNKVHVDKYDRVKDYLGRQLARMGLPLLGVLPYDQSMGFPIMGTICKALKGNVLFNQDHLDNHVAEILAGSLIEIDEFTYFDNVLLVVNSSRFKHAIKKIQDEAAVRGLDHSPLSGVIITGAGRAAFESKRDLFADPYLMENKVPVLTTRFDTYDSVVKISRIEVKINTKTPWKVQRAIELINEHVDLDRILS